MTALTARYSPAGSGLWESATGRSTGSPWQNGIAERLIGTLRRECFDQVIVFGEAHLRRILAAYAGYYNLTRTHAVQQVGRVVAIPVLSGLHHQYARI